MADNFPLSTWDGVNSPWQNIQNWRVYGHSGSGTANTGFRNYGATGVNTSYGTGLGETGFKQGMAVQRTQYRAPNAGVRQRFSGDDQIRSFNSAPSAGIIKKATTDFQQNRAENIRMQEAAEAKQKSEEEAKQRQLFQVNQSISQFKTPAPPPPPSSPIKGSLAETNWSIQKAFPQQPQQSTPVDRPDLAMSPKTREIQERAKAWKANKVVQAPPAEQPSSSRTSKRQQRVNKGIAAIRSIGEWQKQQGALGSWSSKVE